MEISDNNFTVKFHFASGRTLDVIYTQESFDALLKCLAIDWNNSTATNPKLGINFSHVSHYEVLK